MNLADVGRRVKQRRQELGLDQEDMAKQIGRTRGYVSRLEAGKSGENIHDLIAVAKLLGTTLSELVGETDEAMAAEVRRRMPDGTDLAISFERLARAIPGQPASDQEFIRRSISALVDRYAQETETPGDS